MAPLGARLVLALVEDRTRERRVEAVRRDFVANVSHELKTPVGAIRLLAEAVHDAADDPEAVKRFSDRMLTESDRLSRLVQQVIELSRLQGDDPLEAPMPVSTSTRSIEVAVDTSAIDADSKRISIVVGGAPHLELLGNERAGDRRGRQPGRQRGVILRVRRHRAGLDEGRRATSSRSRWSTRASASRPTRSTGSSSGSTGSTRPGTAPPVAPASACPSSSTSPPPTAATSACGPSRARGRRSP